MRQNRLAFTLIELLIVVAIIAILAAIAVPNFLEAQVRSKVSRCKADMRSVVTALESYAVDNSKYPPMADNTPGLDVRPVGNGFHSRMPTFLTTPIQYVTSMFEDPFVKADTAWSNNTYPLATRVGMRYAYYETVSLSAPAPDGYTDLWNKLVPWVGSWLLYGYGPDRTALAPNNGTLIPYDATNGTVSAGNIVRCQQKVDGTPIHPRTGTFSF